MELVLALAQDFGLPEWFPPPRPPLAIGLFILGGVLAVAFLAVVAAGWLLRATRFVREAAR